MTAPSSPEPCLDRSLTTPPPIPESARRRVQQLLDDGRLFRYGETAVDHLDAAELEREFAALLGRRFCVATNSCGAALAIALRASGVRPGDPVLMNAFTLAPVPGALAHVGAKPVLVEIDDDYHIDLESLAEQARRSGAGTLLLSYMRGHIPDMDAVSARCDSLGIRIVEDCAHTMGADWSGRPAGTFGTVGCFSTQTYKHVNSGEGGLLVTDDPDVAAQAIFLSGSYMLDRQHGTVPAPEVMDRHRRSTPNWSMRMTALTAALIRPQLSLLPERRRTWRRLHDRIVGGLVDLPGLRLPERPPEEGFVPSSLQFSVDGRPADVEAFVERCAALGLHVKWFGRSTPTGFTSRFDHWTDEPLGAAPRTARILQGLCDIRLPLDLSDDDADTISAIVRTALAAIRS